MLKDTVCFYCEIRCYLNTLYVYLLFIMIKHILSLNYKGVNVSIKKKLLDIVRDKIRFKHYSISTEKTYTFWIKHYIFFHNKKHPVEMGKAEIVCSFNIWHSTITRRKG